MILQFWINCVLLLYIVPTYALYFFQFYIIYLSTSKHKFVSSFYFIYDATAINDILAHIFINMNYRYLYSMDGVEAIASLMGHHWTYTVFIVLMFHAFFGHSFFLLALSINRYTILATKKKHASFWEQRKNLIILFIVCLPFVLTAPILFDGNGGILMQPQVDNVTSGYIIVEDAEQNIFHNHGLQAAVVQLVCIVVCFVLNITVSYKLWKRTQKNVRQGIARFGNRTHKAEVILFFYSILCMLLEFFVFITQTAFAVASSRNYSRATVTLLFIQQYVLDVQYLFPAWFMILASSQMKHEMVARLPCRKKLLNVTTAVVVKSQSIGPPMNQMEHVNPSNHHSNAM